MPNHRGDLSIAEVALRAHAGYQAAYGWTRPGIKGHDGYYVGLPCYYEGGQKWVKPDDLRRFLAATTKYRRSGNARRKRALHEPEYFI